MHWFRFWTDQRQGRRRRAYFRPTDPSVLDAALLPWINQIVTVRFTDVASADSPVAGQRLYRITEHGTSVSRFVRR